MLSSLTEIFCLIDDFCKLFNQNIFLPDDKKRNKQSKMTLSEIRVPAIFMRNITLRKTLRKFEEFASLKQIIKSRWRAINQF